MDAVRLRLSVRVSTMIATLEEDDDVQNVYSNFEMSDEDAAKLDA